MKKYLVILVAILLLFGLCACQKEEKQILKVYNCVDYIDESVLDDFVTYYKELYGEDIEVVYDTFETNESMYNTIRTGKTSYDLICPSDYMIQKMLREDRLEAFDFENYDLDTYFANCSPYLIDLFDNNGWRNYAACYMWGTLGVCYNPEILADAKGLDDYDVESWNAFLDPDFKGMVSIKDSVRDTYCVGSILAFQDELSQTNNQDPAYQQLIEDVINRVGDSDIEKVEKELRKLKENIYGLEVDSGKGDIVTGKIAANLAWSGDAVYSIELAREEDIELRYCVPNEGGNVWFDAWVMPKGANKKNAQAFINFLSQPEIAARNMEEIGYTPGIAGDEIFELIDEWYGVCDETESFVVCDLTYFFEGTLSEKHVTDGKVLIAIDEEYIDREFSTHYPDLDTLNRCGVMKDFKEQNEKVLQMWINVKANKASIYLIVGLIAFALSAVLVFLYTKSSYIARKRRLKNSSK